MVPNLYEQVKRHSRITPNRVALWEWGRDGAHRSKTYRQLAAEAEKFAKAFAKHLKRPQIVPMYLNKSARGVAAMIGAVGAGHTFSCLNKKFRLPQMNSILQDSRASIALIDEPGVMSFRTRIEKDSPITRTRWWLIPDESFINLHKTAMDTMSTRCQIDSWPQDIITGREESLPNLRDNWNRIGCCLFTSGSTGTPKGVLITEYDLRMRAEAEVAWFELGRDDVLLSALPFSFDVGLNQFLSAMMVGCQLVLLDSWLPTDILSATAQFKVTGISGVPAIWANMLNADMNFETSAQHAELRYITVSGGDLSPLHLSQLERLAPNVGIFKTYGQTEAFRTASLCPDEFDVKPYSVGRAFEKSRFYVVREDYSVCEPDELGEILHTGLGIMAGYLEGEESQDKLIPNPFFGDNDSSKNAIITGDLGCVDENGYLFIKGRLDSMLKISGNRVYPEEITNMLFEIKVVQEAQVIGIKRDNDTYLFAYVVLTPGADLKMSEIRQEMANRVPSYMVPRKIVLMEEMPRTESGKIDQAFLTEHSKRLLF